MLGWIMVYVILGSVIAGAIGFVLYRYRSGMADAVVQARFDAWCR